MIYTKVFQYKYISHKFHSHYLLSTSLNFFVFRAVFRRLIRFDPAVCLSVYLSICLSVCLSVCLFVYLSVCLFVCLSVCLSIWLSVCVSQLGIYFLAPSLLLSFNAVSSILSLFLLSPPSFHYRSTYFHLTTNI